MKRNHVGDEDVTSPSSYHVKVKEGSSHSPKSTSVFESFDPEIEGDHEKEDGDSFVIVGSSYRSRDVT